MLSFRIVCLSSLLIRFSLTEVQSFGKLDPPSFIVEIFQNYTPVNRHLISEELLKPNSAIVTCILNERVTSEDHFQDTRFLKFTLEHLHYDPGDVLIVRPQNSDEAVDLFFRIFKTRNNDFNENSVIRISKNIENSFIPIALERPVFFKNVVKDYFNLNMVPRRYVFEIFSHFTDNEEERQKLNKFTGAGGAKELYRYCLTPKRTIIEVLKEFPGVVAKIPVHYMFEIFQEIRPRSYSIASSSKVHKGEIHLLVAVVKYKTDLEKPRIGLCSTWLASLRNGSTAAVYLANGLLSFPKQNASTVIMVGPGTGIAPFRSYAFHTLDSNKTNKNYVFFGCRSRTADYYFADDWTILQKGNKTHLFTAFSRDQPEKIYVQHVIEKNAKKMWKLIVHEKASIYIAGNAIEMPRDVENAFISCYSKYENASENCAKDFFSEMKINKKYQTEVW